MLQLLHGGHNISNCRHLALALDAWPYTSEDGTLEVLTAERSGQGIGWVDHVEDEPQLVCRRKLLEHWNTAARTVFARKFAETVTRVLVRGSR